jgi:hypothetical protein
MFATLWAVAVVAQWPAVSVTPQPVGVVGCCDACGVREAAVLFEIKKLETFPDRKSRDHAAKALRKYDWRCHPEAVAALVTALLNDCDGEVREEAAESLAKMAPCLPEAHAALQKAAACDPHHATRKWARRGLKALGRRCQGDCKICGPSSSVVIPGPAAVGEPALVPEAFAPPPAVEVSPLVPRAEPAPAPPADPAAPPLVPPADLPAPLPEAASPPPADPPAAARRPAAPATTRRAFRPLLLLGRRRAEP